MMTETRMDVQAECLDAETVKPTKLPLRAEALLRLLIDKRGRNESCWPSEGLLAREMQCSVRTVRRLLAELREAGLIESRRLTFDEQRETGQMGKSPHTSANHWITPRGAAYARSAGVKVSYAIGQNCPMPQDKSVLCDRTEMAYATGQNCPIDPLPPLDGTEFIEGEGKEAVPPSLAAQAQPECQEHPQVEARLRQIQEFETSPVHAKIEAEIQSTFPILASEPVTFSRACVDAFLDANRERPFLDFKRDFMRRVTGCPKDGSFIDDWEKPFAKLGATAEELAMALESYIGDERRDWRDSQGKPTWEGRFAKDALRHLIGYIHKRRKAMRHLDASRHEASKPAVVPKEPARPLLVDGDDAAKVAAKLRELIGPGRFELWFGEGKGARFERGSSGVVLRVRNEMLKGELRTRFRVELRQALAEVLGDGVPFEIVVGVSEEAAKQ